MNQKSYSSPVAIFCALSLSTFGCFEFSPPVSGADAGPSGQDVVVVDSPDVQVENRPDVRDEPDAVVIEDEVAIVEFGVSPNPVPVLVDALIVWSSANAESCTLSETGGTGFGDVEVVGERTVTSTEVGLRTFELSCTGGGDTVSETLTLTVNENIIVGDQLIESETALAGLVGVNVVQGNLSIINVTGLDDLSALSSLVRVEGNINIVDNEDLLNIDLPNLARIDERLYVSGNFLLARASLNGLVAQVEGREGVGRDVLDYYNNPTPILSNLTNSYICSLSQGGEGFLELSQGLARFFDVVDGQIQPFASATGTTNVNGENMTILLNNGTLIEPIAQAQYELDKLAIFRTPTFSSCFVVSGPAGVGVPTQRTYTCNPGTLNGVTEQFNITMGPGGGVLFERTQFLPDEQPAEVQNGLYVLDEGRVHFLMANWTNFNRLMSGDIPVNFATLNIDELQNAGMNCTVQNQ